MYINFRRGKRSSQHREYLLHELCSSGNTQQLIWIEITPTPHISSLINV